MSPHRAFHALFLFAALWGCGVRVLPTPEAARTPHEIWREVPLGLCEDYPEETRSLEEVRRDLAVLEAGGVQLLRISIGWDAVEPQKDRYDFEFWDAFVEMATAAGITLIPYVAYTPDWNSDGAPESFWKTPPRDTREFAELMQLLAARYRGRIRSWEIWNEPDNADYWLGDARQFAELLLAGAEGVRAGDPEARLVLGGLAGGVGFLRELFEQPGVAEHIDVVNLHGYYETWNPNPIETFAEYIGEVQQIVQRRGARPALWLAEVGYSDFTPLPGSFVGARYAYEHTLAFQAVVLVRTLALLLAEPAVSLIAWYELKDARPDDAVIGDAHNRHLGVAFADHRPKPALAALAFMHGLFEGGFRSIDEQLAVKAAPGSTEVVKAFITSQRELVVVAWLRTHLRAAPAPASESQSHEEDARREIVRVAFARHVRGPAKVYDATGTVRGELPVRDLRGASELELELRGGEVQVLRIPFDANEAAAWMK